MHRDLHSFPTRRSSDLLAGALVTLGKRGGSCCGAQGIAANPGPLQNHPDFNGTLGDGAVGTKKHQWSCGHSRSEEHTSELQSRLHLVCRLLLEKKKNNS